MIFGNFNTFEVDITSVDLNILEADLKWPRLTSIYQKSTLSDLGWPRGFWGWAQTPQMISKLHKLFFFGDFDISFEVDLNWPQHNRGRPQATSFDLNILEANFKWP